MQKNELAKLLNDYHNSEHDCYFYLKNQLQNGIILNFTFLSLNEPTHLEPIDFFYATYLISERKIDVGYNYSELEHNTKILLFDDDTIEFSLYENNNLINKAENFSLKPFSSYSINRPTNLFKSNKFVSNYQIHIKLKKNGEARNVYEKNTLDNPALFSQKIKTDISAVLKVYSSKNLEEDYPQRLPWIKERLKLWGYETKNLSAQQISQILKDLGDSDFGIKDIVQLTYILDVFVKEDTSNQQMYNMLEKITSSRKKTWEATCQMISKK